MVLQLNQVSRTLRAKQNSDFSSKRLSMNQTQLFISRGSFRTPIAICLFALSFCGCRIFTPGPQAQLPNPLEIPVSDQDFAWNQIVDTIDDYFDISHEERVRVIGNVMTEGHIATRPETAPTVLEIWRKDRTPGFQTWESTFQSIRRQAEIRVSPSSAGYGVQIIVRNELEDLARPEAAVVGGVIQRYDGSLVRPSDKRIGGQMTLGWIPQGRDIALEQKILRDLYARMYNVVPPPQYMKLKKRAGRPGRRVSEE